MIPVRLVVESGALVTEGRMPPYQPPPRVLSWGSRLFLHDPKRTDGETLVYVEVFYAALVVGPDGSMGTPPAVEGAPAMLVPVDRAALLFAAGVVAARVGIVPALRLLDHAQAPREVEALHRMDGATPREPLPDLPGGEAEGGFRAERVRRAAKAQEPRDTGDVSEIVLTPEQKRDALEIWARSGPQGPIDRDARPLLDLRVPLVLWDTEQLATLQAFLEATVCEAMQCWADNPARLAAAAAVGAIQHPPAGQAPDAAGRDAVARALAEVRNQGAPR